MMSRSRCKLCILLNLLIAGACYGIGPMSSRARPVIHGFVLVTQSIWKWALVMLITIPRTNWRPTSWYKDCLCMMVHLNALNTLDGHQWIWMYIWSTIKRPYLKLSMHSRRSKFKLFSTTYDSRHSNLPKSRCKPLQNDKKVSCTWSNSLGDLA